MSGRASAYTLVEVLVAVAIIAIAVAAAGALALATTMQEEANARVARSINLQEQAVRLYQLGMTPDAIANLLPPDPNVVSIDFSAENVPIPNLGTVEEATCTLTFTTSDATSSTRSNVVTAIRPAIR